MAWTKNLFYLVLVVTISFFSYNSLLKKGYFPMHDDKQPIRVLAIDKCLKDGQIPCRWNSDLGFGYGYPEFIFYSPLAYYFTEIIHLTGFSILTSIKITFITSFIFSGLTMFLLGRLIWGPLGGLVSSAFYVYAPYRATDVYARGAVGEFWALIFFPLILWALKIFINNHKSYKNSLILSLSLAGLLLSHNLSFIAFAPIIVLWLILLIVYFKKYLVIPRLLFSVFIGFCLSSFYTIPLIFERSQVHLDSMISGYFNYLAHYTSLYQLFISQHFGYGASVLGPNDDLSFSIGTIHWLLIIISLILLFLYRYKVENKFIFISFGYFLLVFILSIFLTHPRSSFVWQSIDYLKYFQFPWRFLILTIFSSSVIAGVPSYIFRHNKKLNILISSIIIFVVIVFNAKFFHPQNYIQINDSQKFSGTNWYYQISAGIFDYLPKNALYPPSSPAPLLPKVIEGNSTIYDFQKGTNWQSGIINATTPSIIQLPLFYYPGFKLSINNQSQSFTYQNELGLITFNVPAGKHHFYVNLSRTLDRLIADLLTMLSIIIILFFSIKEIYIKYNNKTK